MERQKEIDKDRQVQRSSSYLFTPANAYNNQETRILIWASHEGDRDSNPWAISC